MKLLIVRFDRTGSVTLNISLLGLALAAAGGCLTAESVAAKLRQVQSETGVARTNAEWASARGDGASAVANAAAALRTFRDAQAWVDAYVTAHGRGASAQFEPTLRAIAAEAEAAGAAALKAGATRESIEAEAVRHQSWVQAGGGGAGGGAGGGGGGM